MYYYAVAFVWVVYAFHTLLNDKALWVAQLAPIIYLLQVRVFWLLWFGGVFSIRFVGSPPFLLILSGQAKYFFIPFKGTSKANQTKQQQQQNKNILNKNFKNLKEEKRKKMTMYKLSTDWAGDHSRVSAAEYDTLPFYWN